MKHLSAAAGTLLMVSSLATAAISNWELPNDQPYEPTDSLEFSYSSDHDTTISRIYIETADASSGLDTAEDGLMFTIMMIDNGTEERWGNDKGLMVDRDPADGDFLFNPGRTGLPPALYYVRLSDGESALVDTFRVVPIADPYRTISGTVVPPSGEDASFIMVSLDAMDMDYDLSAFTNSTGEYSIVIDQATVNAASGKIKVRVEGEFEGYIPEPMGQGVDVSAGDKSGVDFKFVAATCTVSGKVTADNSGVADVRVMLTTTDHQPVAGSPTDVDGNYTLYGVPGSYIIRIEGGNLDGYLMPKELQIDLKEGDDVTVNIELPKADAYVYGRVTVKGSAPSLIFAVSAWSESVGGNWSTTDEDGFFAIPVVASAGKYGISLVNRDEYQIPDEYILENGRTWVEVEVGDTAYFNLIDKPSGGISGTIENATGMDAARYFVRVYGSDQQGGQFQFETTSDGNYTFDGIPEGTYYAEAGMSVAGGDAWKWNYKVQYGDGNGQMTQITIGTSIVGGIDWKLTSSDTGNGGPIEQQKGNGTLLLTVTDETGTTFEKGEVMLFENMPGPEQQSMPVRSYPFNKTGEEITLNEVPNKKLFVGVQIVGNDGDMVRRFVAFAANSDGSPLVLDFSTADTLDAAVTVTAEDSISDNQGPIEPVGNGKVSGTVTYDGDLPTDDLYVLLYDEKQEDFVHGVSPSENGSYVIDNVAPGKYRLAALIVVGDDKDAAAVTIGDETLVFTDDESYENIDITLTDKPTGTGGISGTVTTVMTLPANTSVIVAAIPVDTTKADSLQLNQAAFMMSYHVKMEEPGDYTIEDLPDGVYLIVAIAEVADDSSKDEHQVGIGVHGTLLTDPNAEFPFEPIPVIVADGEVVGDIDVALLSNGENIPVRHERSAAPVVFSMKAAAVNRSNGMLLLQFGLPEKAMVGFKVFDLTGRVVAQLTPKAYPAGRHAVAWNLAAAAKRLPATGTYVLQLEGNRYNARQILRIIR